MNLSAFLNPVALALVLGGTALAALLRSPAADLRRAVAAVRTLVRPAFDGEPKLAQIASLSRIAQRHGVMALDRSVIADPDVATAVADIVDGVAPALVAEHVERRRLARIERHCAAAEVWAGAAEAAPAMGMIGTLVGLVRMFASMTDPAAIGGAMATALLATLYGALLANLVALPIAHRLRARAKVEASERARLLAPLVALAEREAPRGAKLASVA